MTRRHTDAHAAMVEAHAKESKELHVRHQKEMADHMETAAKGKVDATAGSPPELGKPKDEGKSRIR